MNELVDLRSDTVSKPTREMLAAMTAAELGDDVFGDDPTVNRLEAMAAERMGKEAALYVPSGTMANLLAVMTHTRPGDEIILGDQCHIMNYEVAGVARLAQVLPRTARNVTDEDTNPLAPVGSVSTSEVESLIRVGGLHAAGTTLFCLENTHNRCGGAAIPLAPTDELAELVARHGIRSHLDGARIFNAATALETEAARIAAPFDSVSFCLSKGLGCPVGSLLCGPKDFIAAARRNRKMLGGGMRQAGVLAAAGVYALEHNTTRLDDDHANAARLADGLRAIGPFRPNHPETNIVLIDVDHGTTDQWLPALRDHGVLATSFGPQRIRMVTHLNIDTPAIDRAIEAAKGAARALAV